MGVLGADEEETHPPVSRGGIPVFESESEETDRNGAIRVPGWLPCRTEAECEEDEVAREDEVVLSMNLDAATGSQTSSAIEARDSFSPDSVEQDITKMAVNNRSSPSASPVSADNRLQADFSLTMPPLKKLETLQLPLAGSDRQALPDDEDMLPCSPKASRSGSKRTRSKSSRAALEEDFERECLDVFTIDFDREATPGLNLEPADSQRSTESAEDSEHQSRKEHCPRTVQEAISHNPASDLVPADTVPTPFEDASHAALGIPPAVIGLESVPVVEQSEHDKGRNRVLPGWIGDMTGERSHSPQLESSPAVDQPKHSERRGVLPEWVTDMTAGASQSPGLETSPASDQLRSGERRDILPGCNVDATPVGSHSTQSQRWPDPKLHELAQCPA